MGMAACVRRGFAWSRPEGTTLVNEHASRLERQSNLFPVDEAEQDEGERKLAWNNSRGWCGLRRGCTSFPEPGGPQIKQPVQTVTIQSLVQLGGPI
jgi:hypothetical protein